MQVGGIKGTEEDLQKLNKEFNHGFYKAVFGLICMLIGGILL
ncbi:hypothetical protein [Alkalihalobacillus pseudalcaliphilus]|nr:hypothetical protein [Alkalihalobacillus pseudalcaliphilus]